MAAKLAEYNDIKTINLYKDIMYDGLKNSFPNLAKDEIMDAIEYSIMTRLYNGKASIDNNYDKKRVDGTVLDVLRYIQSLEPIMTSSGVLFKKHKNADNPLNRMVQGFLAKRKEYKSIMFKYPKGTTEFERYNLFQLLMKLNANAIYGNLGSPTSLYYNIYVAEAVTRQGRAYISCSIMLFESLLANNVKFNSLNEVITFIYNVKSEKPNRKFKDCEILDRNITAAECFNKVATTIDQAIWIPTENELDLIWEYIRGLDQEDINRIYYKNNLYSFCELPKIMDLIIKTLSRLGGTPICEYYIDEKDGKCKCKVDHNIFLNPNKPPKSIRDNLSELTAYIKEYVYYPHFYIDKLDRINYMQRDIVIITDTDSTIISFDAWYRFILSKVYNIDMPIKHEKRNMVDLIHVDEFGDKDLREMITYVEPELDYDFYTDEVIELERYIDPCVLVPQDNLKYSIINIMAYVCSDLIVDYLLQYSKLSGSYAEGVKCRLVIIHVVVTLQKQFCG